MLAEKLREIIHSLEMLPALPVVVQRLLEVAQDKRSTAEDMGEVISKDEGITSRLLKLVNSSFYGFSKQVSTISRAVVILGFDAVQNLAVGISASDLLAGKEDAGPLDRDRFWQHGIAAAAAGRLLAQQSGYNPAEEAFIAGLLHDAGRAFLNQYAPRAIEMLFERAKEQPERNMVDIEQDVLGINHCILGANIFKHWKLPEQVIWATRRHHSTDTDSTDKNGQIEAITYLANALAKIRRIGSSGDDTLPPLPKQLMNRLGLDDGHLLRVLMEMDQEVEKAGALLQIEMGKTENDVPEHPGRLLLVGTTPAGIRPLKLTLEAGGYHLTVVRSQALDADTVEKEQPDILVVDASDGTFDLDSLNGPIPGERHSVVILPRDSERGNVSLGDTGQLVAPVSAGQLLGAIDTRRVTSNE